MSPRALRPGPGDEQAPCLWDGESCGCGYEDCDDCEAERLADLRAESARQRPTTAILARCTCCRVEDRFLGLDGEAGFCLRCDDFRIFDVLGEVPFDEVAS